MNNIIDLNLLHSNIVDKIDIDEKIILDKSYYENSDVLGFNYINAKGYIKRETDDYDYINLKVDGEMILADSISLEEVNYPFSFEIDGNLQEILENSSNRLDIFELLWENIVLEVPLKFTKENDLSKFHGDGWSLVSEDNIHKNNPFNELLEEIGKE